MKIAVVGLGVAGSYLVRRLSMLGYEVRGFERQPLESFKAICAWGTSRNAMKQLLRNVDFDFDDFLLHLGGKLTLDNGARTSDIPLKGLCTYDKASLEVELARGLDVAYGSPAELEYLLKRFDLVVDATGVTRALLPRPSSDEVVPCFEYRMRYLNGKPYDDFYVRIFSRWTGYLWYFPLGEDEAYLGAGDMQSNQVREVNSFSKRHGGEVVVKVGKAVRITPPELSQPIVSGKVVGVGESVGTVYPMLGEGIVPSLECAELFVENIDDLDSYVQKVLERFKPFADVYRMVKLRQRGELSLLKHMPLLMRCYRYMKEREDRFGMTIRYSDLQLILEA
ncbi:MAG: NAD(P)/FAD-dependent oxidoreductase [Candidatus Caldarchaeum sp.]|uniref:NAD(P)/FAD-dependent oxidoreductase n=1 Tax=Caldiarchaeum subterraneum TaxID=311458 RepID=A0A7J3VTG8_CALS0